MGAPDLTWFFFGGSECWSRVSDLPRCDLDLQRTTGCLPALRQSIFLAAVAQPQPAPQPTCQCQGCHRWRLEGGELGPLPKSACEASPAKERMSAECLQVQTFPGELD